MHNELTTLLQNTYPYIYQEYISESHGRDIRVIVVGDKAVFSMTRQSNTPSVRANLSAGGKGTIITGQYPTIEQFAVRIHKLLGLEISGVDLLTSRKHGVVCCEVNNCPGFSKSLYAGHNIEKAVGDYLLQCTG